MKVLIVDDDELSRAMLVVVLKSLRLGTYDIREAADGFEALRLYHFWKPGLIITDQEMPELSGNRFADRVRESAGAVVILLYASEVAEGKKCSCFDGCVAKGDLTGLRAFLTGMNMRSFARPTRTMDRQGR